MVSLDMLLPLIREIQTQLREMRNNADLDRRNTRSLYDNLAAEMTQKLAAIDNKLEIAAERFEDRMGQFETRFDQLEILIKDK